MRFLQTAIAACILASLSLPGLAQEDLAALNSRVEELYGKGDLAGAMKVAKKLEEAAERQLGPDHPDTAACLNTLAFLCQAQGEYAKAEPLFKRALAVREKTLGPDHPGTAQSLNNLAELYQAQGQYAKAEPLLKRALAIKEKVLGPDHPDTAVSLNNLARIYESEGQYAQAEPLYKRALVIKEKALGPDHPSTATSLNNLATLYRGQGQYAQAEPLLKRALAIMEKTLGPDHPSTATCLNNLALLYERQGQYAEAEPLYKRALAITEKTLGPDHPDTAVSLNNLAGLFYDQGQYAEAEPLYERALAIREKTLGPDHAGTAQSLNNLASVYDSQGQYSQAEPLLKRALAITEKTLGPDHPSTATSLSNLAGLYAEQGQYAEAEPLLKRALAIKEKSLGPDHPTTAVSLNNLALLYQEQGQYAQAEPLYKRALVIKEKSLGPDHPDTALSLSNLAGLFYGQGQYAEAEPLFKRALVIKEKALGPDHPSTATSLNNLATLYRGQGQYAQAEPLLKRALAINEKTLGPDHPTTATSLNNLACEQAAAGDWLAAVGSIDRARHGIRRHVARVLPSLSDREQIQFLKVRDDGKLHSALSIGLAKADDPKITSLSAGWLANAKSVGQEAAAERIIIAREGNNPAAKKLADELTAVRRQLAALRQSVTAAAESKDILKKIGELEEQERSLIRGLGVAVPWVEKDDPWVGIDAIRRAIPAGTVFVDIARFAVRDFAYVARDGTPYDPFLPARYAAWIVPPAGAGDVRVIDLGDATRIDGLVDEVRSLLNAHSEANGAIATKGEGAAEKELAAATTPLSQLTIQPILRAATKALGAAPKELVISADGKLWLVPFAALSLDDGRYAIEATAIRLVTSGRDLVDPAAAERRSAAVGKPLIMAAPDFDNESAGRAANQKVDSRGVSPISSPITARRLPKVGALPGTLDEAMAVAPSVGTLANAHPDVVTGADATEAKFKTTPRPIVAILATHGFFLPDQQLDRKLLASLQGSDGGGRGLADSRGEALENPLTRCGLLFAGCNRANAADAAANATEDGVLTGLEIIGCDLRGTKLVVLSACQTGLGDVEAGQGVAGLRQAFQLAGARSVVATLWSVPDRETAELSSGMFANLADGKTTSDCERPPPPWGPRSG